MQNIYWPASLLISVLVSMAMLSYARRFEPKNFALAADALLGQRVFLVCAAILGAVVGLEAILSVLHPEAIQYEPEGASLIAAWLFAHGQPLYHAAGNAQRYSLLYGPMMYLPFSAIFKFGGGMALVRAVGVFGVALAVASMWVLARVSNLRGYLLLYGVGALCLILPPIFTGRADAISFAMVVLGATAACSGNLLALAAFAAIAVGAKATAVLYFIPLLFLLLQERRQRAADLWFAFAVFTGLVLLPFAVPGISLRSYVYWLSAAAKHGLVPELLVMNVVVLVTLAAPAIWAAVASAAWRQDDRRPWWGLWVAVASGVVLSVPAAKVGSGYFHIVPFAPVFMLVLVRAGGWRLGLVQRSTGLVFAAFLLLSVLFMARHVSVLLFGERTIKVPDAALVEIDHYIAAVGSPSTLSMGAGDLSHRQTNAALYVLRHGGAYLINDVTMWDMEGSGIAIPEKTIEAISTCQVPNWLIPAGDKPFHSQNLYAPDRLIFGPIEAIFSQRYELVEHGHYYDLWRCRKAQ
ncbi:hypothetical protein [Duganella vulcania]|uniref:Glycosyltransferase RgtA/B/C/D-like domain-containing protein n=1 Tax=Duganella vulcania TaxID=2692166 RepID=A0A845GHU7_9BURK|nr:hypothetical protein [Duganella vulcania]MYM92337.1 hypothetical protein [Duganella vulcania]